MLLNPFTPSEIASLPEDFFGRKRELELMERSLAKGSVAIQGAVGIGKSSLLARVRLMMEGFASGHRCHTVVAVGNKDTRSVDDAARMMLDRFLKCDESHKTIRVSVPKFLDFESKNVYRFFKEGRHLEVLCGLIEEAHIPEQDLLVLAIDEADKCPVFLARMVRSVLTQLQQSGVKNVRFALAGVSPFFHEMASEDSGVNRFFYKTLTLLPLPEDEASELVESKLTQVIGKAEEEDLQIVIQPDVIERVVRLSGGHPHLLQLLGSHLIEHENENADGRLDAIDLAGALHTICYEDRAGVYDSVLHTLEVEGKLGALRELMMIASYRCPTRIDRRKAQDRVDPPALDWMVTHNILTPIEDNEYGLVDEFLRIRLLLDDRAKGELEGKREEVARTEPEELLLEQARFFAKQRRWEQQSLKEKERED